MRNGYIVSMYYGLLTLYPCMPTYINTYKEPCTVNRPSDLPFPCLEGLTMLTWIQCIMYIHCTLYYLYISMYTLACKACTCIDTMHVQLTNLHGNLGLV